MATYFNQEDIDAAIQEKVDELGQSLAQRITAFTESISTQLSSLSTSIETLEQKLAGLE